MADVNASIRVDIATAGAVSQLRQLQSQINSFNNSIARGNAAAAASQGALAKSMSSMIASSGLFATSIHNMETSTKQLGTAFDKGTLSARQYFRYAASQVPGLVKAFRSLGVEQAAMSRLAETRVKKLQTQYASLGKDIHGMEKVLAARPTVLPTGAATQMAVAAQKAQLLNRALQLGSTGLVNWGKNTQWAGRQLMVGFTIPLTIAAGAAAKFYMEIDKASMQFRRVYGDLDTSANEANRNLEAIKALGAEYTKYGIAVKDVIGLGARVAATGAQNQDLMAATEQTLRFATLGQMDYQQALDSTISLQTAFGISSEDLGKKINFLNAVENQTILTMEDMALAVPRVAPVIKGLGGDVEDLAVFMTALREGGVSAENGANALKSGLASLINPTDRARESLRNLGINIDEIVQTNKGDLMGTVRAFGDALSMLGSFEQQQALEQVFGKYQYAKLGALFKNISNDASQSARAMQLAGASAEELAMIADKELGVVAETTTNKFLAAIENLKVAMAPIGETFLKALTPIINAISAAFDWFSKLPEGVKTAISAIVGIVAGIAPVVLMGIGLLGNAIGNGLKFILALRMGFKGLLSVMTGGVSSFKYMTEAEIESQAAMASLTGSVSTLTGDLLLQQSAVDALISAYTRLATAARTVASSMPTGFAMPGMVRGGIRPPTTRVQGFNSGVVGVVPGTGNKDTIPAILTPGESVVTKEATAKYKPVLQAMNAGTLKQLYGGEVDLNNVYTNIYGETAARLQPKTENISQRASVPQLHQVMPILALRAGEVQNIKLTQANLAAGLFDPIAKDLTGITRKFLKQVGQHFHGTYKHIADTDQRLRAAWTHTGRSMVSDVEALPAQYRQVFRRFAGLDPDVVNTLATAKRNAGDTVLSSRRQPIQTISVSGVKSLAETGMNPLMVRAQQRWFSHIAVPEQQDIGHIYGGTRVPMSHFAGMPGLTAEPQRALREVTGNPNAVFPNTKQAARAGAENADAYNKSAQKNIQDPVAGVRKPGTASPLISGWASKDAFVYSKTFTANVGTIPVPIKPVPTGTMPQVSAAGAGVSVTGTRVGPVTGKTFRVDGGVASVYNPRNNPQNLGIPSQARTTSGKKAIESTEQVKQRKYQEQKAAEQRQERQESQSRRVVDKRLTGAKREQVVVLGKEKTWLDRNNEASKNLAAQKTLNATALQESTKAEQSRNAQSARVAAQAATANMRPATGNGILSRIMAPIRRFAYPQGRGGLRNLGISPYQGPQTTSQIIKSEASQVRKAVGDRASSMWTSAKNSLNGYVTQLGSDLKNAGKEMVTTGKEWRDSIKKQSGRFAKAMSGLFGGGGGGGILGGLFGGGKGMDPEQRKMLQQKRMGRAAAGGMALSMASMLPYMMQDKEGKFMGVNANMASMGLMGGGALLSMVGLISGKFIALAGLAAAAGVALYALRNAADQSARAAADMGANLGVSANALKNMGTMMGKPTPTQELAQVQLGLTPDQAQQAFGEFQQMFNTEQGQAFLDKLTAATSPDRFKLLGDYVAAAIASGMMDTTTGQSFAKTIAAYLNDPVLGNAVAQAMTKQEKGTQALIDLAEKRMTAVSDSLAIKEVQRYKQILDDAKQELKDAEEGITRDRTDIIPDPEGSDRYAPGKNVVRPQTILPSQAAAAVGSAIQVIQDFANAAAMAELEYKQGIITYKEYNAAIAFAENAQRQYTDIISTAIRESVKGGSLQQAIISQLEKIGITADQFKTLETASQEVGRLFTEAGINTAGVIENQGQVLGDAIASVTAGVNAADVAATLEFIKDTTTRASQYYQENMGQPGAFQRAGLIGTIESGMMPGVVTAEQKQQVIDFVWNFEGADADLQAFLASVPEERVIDIILNLKSMTPKQQAEYIANAGKMAAIIDSQTQAAVEKYVSQRATKTTGTAIPSGISATRIPAKAKPQTIADIQSNEERDRALKEQEKITEEIQKAKDAGVFEDMNAVINMLLQEDPPDLAARLPEITKGALELKEKVPDEILKTLGIDIQNKEDIDKYAPMAEQLSALAEVYSQIPDGPAKTMGISLMLDQNGDPIEVMQFGKIIAKLQKDFQKLDKIDVKDTVKRKNVVMEIFSYTENMQTGEFFTSEESQQVIDDIIQATGMTEAEFFALPSTVISKTIAAAIGIDTSQLLAAAASAERIAAAFRKANEPGLATQWELKAQGLREAASQSIKAAVALPAAMGGGGTTDSGGGGGGGGGGSEEKDPFKAMMEDLKIQQKLIGDFLKKGGEVKTGFATALRNAGAPEYLIAEIISKGADGIKLAKKLLQDKQKKLKELMDLSLKVTRMTFVESQRAQANNLKAQMAAQQSLVGAGVDATVAMDIASDPKNAEMINAAYQRIQKAKKAVNDASGKDRKKATKELEDAQNAWRQLTGSIKITTKAQEKFNAEQERMTNLGATKQARLNAREQKQALVRQAGALTRLISKDFSFDEAQALAGDDTFARAIVTSGRAADIANAKYQRLNAQLKEMGPRTKKNAKEWDALNKKVKDAKDEADKTSDKYKALIADLRDLTKVQKENLVTNTTKEYEGLTGQLGMQLDVLNRLVAAGLSYDQAVEIASDPQRALAFAAALEEGGDAWKNLIAQTIAYDKALGAFGLGKRFAQFAEDSKKLSLQSQVQSIVSAGTGGGTMAKRVSDYLMGMSFNELQAFLQLAPQLQQQFIDNLLASVPLADKLADSFDQINARQRYSNIVLKDQVVAEKGLLETQDEKLDKLKDELDTQNKIIKVSEQSIKILEEQNNDYNRGLDLISRQEDKINEAFDKRIESLDKVQQANERIAQQQQNQLNLSQALASGDIYAATQAAQQIKQDNAAAAIENTRSGLEEARQNALKNITTDINGLLLNREQIQKRIQENEDKIYQINEDQIEPVQKVIDGINDQIDAINKLKEEWQKYYEDLQKNAVDPITGLKYSVIGDIQERYKALLDLGIDAQTALNRAIDEYSKNVSKLTPEQIAKLQSYFRVSASSPGGTAGGGTNGNTGGGTGGTTTPTPTGPSPAELSDPSKPPSHVLPEGYMWQWDSKNKKWGFISVPPGTFGNVTREQLLDRTTVPPSSALPSGFKWTWNTDFLRWGFIKKFMGGLIPGNGTGDKIPMLSSPGEFIIRNAMVSKYGLPMLNDINQGSFEPSYSLPSGASYSNINKPESSAMYNNSYNINVTAKTNASAEEIANITIMKIKQIDNMQIRSARG